MSGPASLGDLVALTEVMYRAEQAGMRDIVVRENMVRRDLAQLDTYEAQSRQLPEAELRTVRQIGGDVQWQAWLGRNRAELNRQLAICLAQKARLMAALARAHGRHLAADQIAKTDRTARIARRDKRDRATEEALAMIERFGDPRHRG